MTPKDSNYAKKLYMKESSLLFSLCSHVSISWLNLLYLEPRRLQVQSRQTLLGQKSEIVLKAQDGRHKRLKHSVLSVREGQAC